MRNRIVPRKVTVSRYTKFELLKKNIEKLSRFQDLLNRDIFSPTQFQCQSSLYLTVTGNRNTIRIAFSSFNNILYFLNQFPRCINISTYYAGWNNMQISADS